MQLWRRIRTLRGPTLMLIGTVLILLTAGVSVGASKLEENDQFCTNCHLAPERTYYNRAQFALDHQDEEIPDLSTFHYVQALNDPDDGEFRCVDCHRGRQNILHRGQALVIGAYDGMRYVFGGGSTTEIEKGEVHSPGLITASCIQCHSDTLLILGFDNHFHSYLPAAEEVHEDTGDLFVPPGITYAQEQELLDKGLETKETDVTCLSCHRAHVSTIGGERVQFVDEETSFKGCNQCHTDNDLNIDLLAEEPSQEGS
jgi:hypothetical protein